MTEWMSPSYNILLRSHHVKSSQIKLWNILKVTEIDQSSRLNLCCVMKLFLTNERLQVWILAPLKCQYLKTWNNLQQPMIIIISVISTNMGKKEVNTIYSSFQLKERLNFRINLATAIEKIQAAGSTSNDQNGAQQCSKVLKWSEAPKTRMVQCWGQLIAIQCNCIPFKVQLSITVKC